jgi:hypothetical protein
MICFNEKEILKILSMTPRRGAHNENLVKFIFFTIIIESKNLHDRDLKFMIRAKNNTLGSITRVYFYSFCKIMQGIDTSRLHNNY